MTEAIAYANIDVARAEAAVRVLLVAIGEDPDREGLRHTPARVARACGDVFGGLFADPGEVLRTTFDENHDGDSPRRSPKRWMRVSRLPA